MDVIVEDLGFLEPPLSGDQARSLAYAGLRGMSGAPVCRTDSGEVLVYGMVVQRNTGGIANRVYALPVDAMQRFLGTRGYPLRVTRGLDATPRSVSLLMGRLISRMLDSPGGLHQLWADASGLFYSGEPVDAAFHDAIRRPDRFGLESLQVAELEFLLARLLFKRGDEQGGLTMLRRARTLASRSSATEHRQLTALIDLRMVMYSARDLSPGWRRSVFEHGVGAYELTPGTSDDERAYEVASAVGSEATELASDIGFVHLDVVARRHFSGLLAKHTELLTGYPQLLRDKQEIVNIGLSAIEILWGIDEARDSRDRSATLAALAARGRLAATQRGNVIFYAQMLLADAIAARMSGQSYRGFALACIIGTILASSNLRLSHEGVRSYLSYVDAHDGVAAGVLRTAHSIDLSDARTVLLGTNLAPPADRSALDAALAWCQSAHTGVRNVSDIFELESLIRGL
ncbi:MAG TPA: hypothetical protein VH352_10765 [Pseudonocardiaceae bacterium]|nr:hypothetical protein [Pseudonocardiaceae bacterium]